MHLYPVSTKYKPKEEEANMFEMTKELRDRAEKALAGLRTGLDELNSIVADLEKTAKLAESGKQKAGEERRGKKAAATEPEPEKKPVLVQDVTIEMLRETATKYSEVFGMEKLLSLNTKHGGAKKLSGIDPKMYGVVYGAMTDDLAAAATIKTQGNGGIPEVAGGKAKEIGPLTIEKMREHAAAFIAKNGEPAIKAVLKAFGTEKISGVPEDKRGAFLEAIDNA
jgi:hypothetical protein